MTKTSTRSKSTKTQFGGGGVRGRDADFLSAPIHVTGTAQAKIIDINRARQPESRQMERSQLPVRPSTSGGPAANIISLRKGSDKRETKDDLHFNSLGAHGSGTTFYSFPLPGSLPPLSNTPKSRPPVRTSSLPRADIRDELGATPANLSVPLMEIGMALGSPTHQPVDSWQSQAPIMPFARKDTPDSADAFVDFDVHVAGPPKQKASKWKLFGGLFRASRKNTAESSQPFYQLQPERILVQNRGEPEYMNFGEPVGLSEQRPSKSRGWGRVNSQRNADKHKPNIRRAQTAPLNADFQDFGRGRTVTRTPEITLDGGPLLDVDIPSVELERYSVMFGSLLQNPTGRSSSLLARRQATLDRLKTLNEALALNEQELETKAKQPRPRRATSPQPTTKSPAFSLFPTTPSRLTVRDGSPTPNGRSPLQRSNTSPAALSPNRPTFAPGPENETHATLMAPGPHVPVIFESDSKTPPQQKCPSKKASEASSKSQPSTGYWCAEESNLILDSPPSSGNEEEEEEEEEDEEEKEDNIYKPTLLPIRSKFSEPSWKITVPQHVPVSSISGSTSSTSYHSTSTSASSISTTLIAPFAASKLKTVKIQAPPPKLRSRSSTTAATVVQPRSKDPEPSLASAPNAHSSLDNEKPSTDVDDHEARLETAADVSIARQISVSRQQRQLLIPIKASTPTSSLSTVSKQHQHKQNFSSPLGLNMNMNRVTSFSPLGAVASAAAVRAESPVAVAVSARGRTLLVAERKASLRHDGGNKRLNLVTASVEPSMPTLVVVGGEDGAKAWGGKVDNPARITGGGEISIERGLGPGQHRRTLRPGEAHGHGHGHPYRKSERVIVERVSVASN